MAGRTQRLLVILIGLMCLISSAQVIAQPQCGYVDRVEFPVDRTLYQVMQDFAVPSYRHRGWFHTGEDYHGGRGRTLGQPVHAAAAGRVTLASPLAWGRDGGVIIIEHTFSDGSRYYSQYGHVTEANDVRFPARDACVAVGDVIAVIGDARPAPHLHFEIRVNNPDLAGPGYSEQDPIGQGYRRPGKMIYNWQSQFNPAFRWAADLVSEDGLVAAPVPLGSENLLALDDARVLGIAPGGGVRWRIDLNQPASTVFAVEGAAVIVYADGRMQQVSAEGQLGESWDLAIGQVRTMMPVGDGFAAHTQAGELVGLARDARSVLWILADIPPIEEWAHARGILGLATQTHELIVISAAGQVLERTALNAPAALSPDPAGGLLVYSNGGLWPIRAQPVDTSASMSSGGALTTAPDGRVYVFDDEVASAFDPQLQTLWQVVLPGVSGKGNVRIYDEELLIVTNHGFITALRSRDGAVCGQTRVYGHGQARVWQRLGNDGVLRAAVADQILGLNWRVFLGLCG
jgi:hypothetical protein